jgi:protein-L-isoaspartate(D-aspartate) O-methyltransferase
VAALACTCVTGASSPATAEGQVPEHGDEQRRRMVATQIQRRGITDERVLDAMRRVPRHRFVPAEHQDAAYDDRPLPIGHGQTISQPYIVAYMTELLTPQRSDRVLEVGTGSGYQAAVLAELAGEVYTIELVDALAERARGTIEDLGYTNVHVRAGDGYKGWPEAAPFHKIIVTAAPAVIPQSLLDQLTEGGTLVVPVGRQDETQTMTIVRKTADGVATERTIPVRFVPMVPAGPTR